MLGTSTTTSIRSTGGTSPGEVSAAMAAALAILIAARTTEPSQNAKMRYTRGIPAVFDGIKAAHPEMWPIFLRQLLVDPTENDNTDNFRRALRPALEKIKANNPALLSDEWRETLETGTADDIKLQ